MNIAITCTARVIGATVRLFAHVRNLLLCEIACYSKQFTHDKLKCIKNTMNVAVALVSLFAILVYLISHHILDIGETFGYGMGPMARYDTGPTYRMLWHTVPNVSSSLFDRGYRPSTIRPTTVRISVAKHYLNITFDIDQ